MGGTKGRKGGQSTRAECVHTVAARLQVVLERGLQVVREELAPGQLVPPVVGEADWVQALQRLAAVRRGLVAHIPAHMLRSSPTGVR